MTEKEAREKLPDVKVKFGDGSTLPARVSGRKEKYARVTVVDPSTTTVSSFEVCWPTVARCATEGTPIRV